MRSMLVEFHRFNDLGTGILRSGDPYLIAVASHPVRQFPMRIDHAEFLDRMNDLRYKTGSTEREAALKELGGIVTDILKSPDLAELNTGVFPLQLDFVVNPVELAALPFEAVMDGSGQPLLARGANIIELTRRVRHNFAETRVRWPAQPRILFAWANPPGAGVDVPSSQHESALRAALAPWLPPGSGTGAASKTGGALTTLAEASKDSIKQACTDSIEKKQPYTHVHLLAHGYPVGSAYRQRFGIALHASPGGDLEAVTPEELTEALAPLRGQPVVVTLAVCDAANVTNTLVPERSIAHELHVSGLPVVVASQLPLTVPGSILLVERFYKAVLAGKDVRLALHDVRTALYENSGRTGHDWASLVAYVNLPEGYADLLLEERLEAVLAALKNAQAQVDALVASPNCDLSDLERLANSLSDRIQELEAFLKDTEKVAPKGVREENLGLLGSAEKRRAELYFECSKRNGSDRWQDPMRQSLTKALDWYRQGYEYNLSHHWTGVQYLSLQSVLNGKIDEPGRWQAATTAAEITRKKPPEFWAQGSLAELYLLAPLAGQPSHLDAAVTVLEEMKQRVSELGDGNRFPLESTARQLRRYTDWWTTKNGFFPGSPDLAAEAGKLIEVLQ